MNRHQRIRTTGSLAVVALACAIAASASAQTQAVSLAGTWQFRLDAQNDGHRMNWQDDRFHEEVIFLPGSTDEGGYGLKTAGPARGWLSRPFVYEGPAWYQREVVIPPQWSGKRIVLFLERPHWETEVWADGQSFGKQNSLSAPHVYDLTEAMKPGRHRLTICVDNTVKIDVGRNAHSITEHTQTNWNGIVGRIELQTGSPVWIDSAKLDADAAGKVLRIQAVVGNVTGRSLEGELSAEIPGIGGQPATIKVSGAGAVQEVALTAPLGDRVRLWDEYAPELYRVVLRLRVEDSGGAYGDEQSFPFGVRQIATRGKQFVLNGRPIFLRGTLECNIFPRTGYPPTDVESWARLFRIARSYGLNHFRFHSWCPPEAAFTAADEAGFLLHVELPVWNHNIGKDADLEQFMRAEAKRILDTYGNHPSFTMLCLGNELLGDFDLMDRMLADIKQSDRRRLYTFSADFRRQSPGPSSDYYVTHNTALGPLRIHGARFAETAGGTDYDFSKHVAAIPVPLVAHELGQWVVYPSYEEIAKYTGVLKPRNLEAFRDRLAQRGMADQAKAFQLASGRFSGLAYKEDIETALRTPDFGGVQLLQLHDFPGQGEALIGLLDAFWDSKSIFTPQQFREFFSETVPLLRVPKFVWTNDETLRAKVELAHYGKAPLSGAVAEWSVQDEAGRRLASGELPPAEIGLGEVAALGEIAVDLAAVESAARLTARVHLKGTAAKNSWHVWCYPKQLRVAQPDGVTVTSVLDERARQTLSEGGKVLLLWPPAQGGKNVMKMRFLPLFWSLSWFPRQPGTMGILCDPRHPALAAFPTEMHSNWQWWELTEGAPALILDETPDALRPIIQVIDSYHRNHKLGGVFEARVGRGKLLVSSFDLDSDLERRPVARQLRHSVLSYMGSGQFQPQVALEAELLDRLFGGE